ncbi:unnamed protein product [marine sediment metagenome]|uniref:Uncharacterized protein n=1 Tax=marine sediment metagenome TaxID=412755 RepID=X1EQS7_9ZZZZ
MIECKCKRCNRVLKNPKSIELGYGKTCYRIVKLQENNKPEVKINDIEFLRMEINTLKRQIREIRINGIKTVESIERIKIDSNPIRNEQEIRFYGCVRELKGIFNMDNWDYRNVLVPINPRESIEMPPITQII